MLSALGERTNKRIQADLSASGNRLEVLELRGPPAINPMIDGTFGNRHFGRKILLGDPLFIEPVEEQLPLRGIFRHRTNIGHLHPDVNSLPIVSYGCCGVTLGKLLTMTLERRDNALRPFVTKAERDAGLLRNAWERIEKDRVGKGEPRLSRKELAKKHHVTPGLVSHYMRGRGTAQC